MIMSHPTTQRFHAPTAHPHNLTGVRAAQLSEQQTDREAAKDRAALSLRDPAVVYVYVTVPGRGLVPIERDTYEYLSRELAR